MRGYRKMEDMSAVASGHPEAPTQTFSANPVERRQYGTQPTLKVHAPMTAVAELCALALWQLAKYSSRSDGCLSESSNDSNWPAADRRHPAPTGSFTPRSGRSDQKSEMRSRMTAYG
jgi:hypothetical protein